MSDIFPWAAEHGRISQRFLREIRRGFFNISRSIFTRANSPFKRLISICSALTIRSGDDNALPAFRVVDSIRQGLHRNPEILRHRRNTLAARHQPHRLGVTLDLLDTLRDLEARRVSVIALSGITFDLASAAGRMMATVLADIAEFERDLLRERVRSGLAAAKARGEILGRRPGERPKSDRLASKVPALVAQGRSYRLIGRELGLSKNTVSAVVKRDRDASAKPTLNDKGDGVIY